MRFVVCPKTLALRCLSLLLCCIPSLSFSQSESPPLPKWEIGLQVTDMRRPFAVELSHSVKYPVVQGLELYGLRWVSPRVFVRLAAGGAGKKLYPGTNEPFDSNLTRNAVTSYSGVSAEIAVGSELPRIQRKGLDRLRFRYSIGLAYADLLRYREETSWKHVDGYWYIQNQTFRNSAIWQVPVMLQAGFRIAGNLYAGLEWRYGPTFSSGRKVLTRVFASETEEGFENELEQRVDREPEFRLLSSISFPKAFISIGF